MSTSFWFHLADASRHLHVWLIACLAAWCLSDSEIIRSWRSQWMRYLKCLMVTIVTKLFYSYLGDATYASRSLVWVTIALPTAWLIEPRSSSYKTQWIDTKMYHDILIEHVLSDVSQELVVIDHTRSCDGMRRKCDLAGYCICHPLCFVIFL